MTSKAGWTFAVLFVLNVSTQRTGAVDIKSAKETKCFEILETISLEGKDFPEANSVVLSSRLDLYYTAAEVSPVDINDLQEDELYYNACLQVGMKDELTAELTGFGGRTANYTMTYVPPSGMENDVAMLSTPGHFVFKGDSGRSGASYATFSDNSTFIFMATCWDDDQMSWSVAGPSKGLPEDKVKMIHEHAISLGFKKQYFTGLRFDYC